MNDNLNNNNVATQVQADHDPAPAQAPARTPRSRSLQMILDDVRSDNGNKGFSDVVNSPNSYGIASTPAGPKRSRRNKPDFDFEEENGAGGATPPPALENLVEQQQDEEDSGDDDSSASESEDADAKTSCWAALFCCRIFRK